MIGGITPACPSVPNNIYEAFGNVTGTIIDYLRNK